MSVRLPSSAGQFAVTPPAEGTSPRIFYGIEGMRCVCVMLVLAYHADATITERLMPGVYFLVDFFYAVSGFVLSHAYGSRLGRNMSGLSFMRLRLIRVYPLYLLALAIAVAANLLFALRTGLSEPSLFVVSVAASAVLLPITQSLAFRHYRPYPFNGTTWTLFWELVINVVWSVLGPRLTDRVLAIFVMLGVALLLFALTLPTGLEKGGSFATFHVGGLRVVYGFFAGVAAYRLWASGFCKWLRLPLWASAGVFLTIVSARPEGGNFAYDLMAVLAMPVLVFATTATPGRFMTRIAAIGGSAAYAAYILNYPILLTLNALLAKFAGGPASGLAGIGVFVILTWGFAIIADHWIDRPARALMAAIIPSVRTRGKG